MFYYFPTALIAGGIAGFLLGILYRIIYGQWKMKKYIHVFLFVKYIVVFVQIAFLSRSPGSRTVVAFGLGDTWGTTVQEHAYAIENMLMFIPFGVIYPVFGKIATYSCIPIAICASALVEGMQYVTGRGYCQLNDLVMNVVGACIGCASNIFVGKRKINRRIVKY